MSLTNEGMGARSPKISLQPSRQQVRALRRRSLPVVGVVAAGALLRGLAFSFHVQGAALWTAVLILFGGIVLVGQLLVSWRLKTERIDVTDTAFGMTRMVGDSALHPRAALARIVSVKVLYGNGVPAPQWLFLDADGNRLMALNPRVWEPEDLDRLVTELQASVEDFGPPVKAGELRQRLPRAVPWWQAHTLLVGACVAMVLIAALAPLAR
ncbi:MAG TPA: hypothetical protein VFC09_15955 [Candidatus Dormibacteraeota bacterium]|nr:hypothetical protein [Candidatus Dormibacteraeota bacterium]